MSPRKTGLLALIAVALGAFVFFYEIEGDVAREAADDEARKIHSGYSPEQIEAIELVTLDGVPARFERREGRWELVSPIAARADTSALDAIANALVNMPREGSVTRAGALEGFGLGMEAQTIRFEVDGESRGLRIGRSTPVGGHRYVARLADDDVAYVASYRVNAFNRNLDDLRDRRIFRFEAGDVRTLRVTWPASAGSSGAQLAGGAGGSSEEQLEVALARDDAGQWHLGAPLEGPADQEVLRDLLSDLAYLRATGFLDAPGAAADPELQDEAMADALAHTAIRFHWTLEGAHLESSARITGEVDGRRVVEAPDGRRSWIPAERLDDFPRRIVAYRFKRLSSFEVSAARRLEMVLAAAGTTDSGEAQDLHVFAELAETGWSSPPPAIDPDRATRIVRELANLSAIDIVADEMGPAELASLGLDPPLARFRVRGESADADTGAGAMLAELSIGRLDPDRGIFAMRADRPTIFLLAPEVADDLPISAEAYRSDFAITVDADADEQTEAAAASGAEDDG